MSHFTHPEVSETRAVTGLEHYSHYYQYYHYIYIYPPALSGNTNTLNPTCEEELRALDAAPPWAGYWLHKPTLRQRFNEWARYARYLADRLWN